MNGSVIVTARSRARYSPKDILHFGLVLVTDQVTIPAFLGNISEEGLGAIVAGYNHMAVGQALSGIITCRWLPTHAEFEGHVSWIAERGGHLRIGLSFTRPICVTEFLNGLMR